MNFILNSSKIDCILRLDVADRLQKTQIYCKICTNQYQAEHTKVWIHSNTFSDCHLEHLQNGLYTMLITWRRWCIVQLKIWSSKLFINQPQKRLLHAIIILEKFDRHDCRKQTTVDRISKVFRGHITWKQYSRAPNLYQTQSFRGLWCINLIKPFQLVFFLKVSNITYTSVIACDFFWSCNMSDASVQNLSQINFAWLSYSLVLEIGALPKFFWLVFFGLVV